MARLVREAVDRHDPSRGGRGQRRRGCRAQAVPAKHRQVRRRRDAVPEPPGTQLVRPTAGSATPAPECETGAAAQRRHPVHRSRSVKCRRVRQPRSRQRKAGHLPATVRRGWQPRPPLLRCRGRRPARPLATIPCRRLQRPRPPALRRRSRRPAHHLPAADDRCGYRDRTACPRSCMARCFPARHSRRRPAPGVAARSGTLLLSRSDLRPALYLRPSAAARPPAAGRSGRRRGPGKSPRSLLCTSPPAAPGRTGYATGVPGAGRCHDAEAGPLTAG